MSGQGGLFLGPPLQIPTDGLLAYYRFDESAGATAHEDWNGYHVLLSTT